MYRVTEDRCMQVLAFPVDMFYDLLKSSWFFLQLLQSACHCKLYDCPVQFFLKYLKVHQNNSKLSLRLKTKHLSAVLWPCAVSAVMLRQYEAVRVWRKRDKWANWGIKKCILEKPKQRNWLRPVVLIQSVIQSCVGITTGQQTEAAGRGRETRKSWR